MKEKFVQYNYDKFNFVKFFDKGKNVSNLNEILRYSSKVSIYKKIKNIKKNKEFIKTYKNFIKLEIQKIFNEEIVFQKLPNIRVLYPNDIEGVVPYHCDKWYNHTEDEINFWLPLHKVSKSESMQFVDLRSSRMLEKKILKNKLNYAQINSLISRFAKPVKCDLGSILKFSPLHLHGNIVNKTRYPRLSIDFRVKKLNSKFQTKTLGGYFDIIK